MRIIRFTEEHLKAESDYEDPPLGERYLRPMLAGRTWFRGVVSLPALAVDDELVVECYGMDYHVRVSGASRLTMGTLVKLDVVAPADTEPHDPTKCPACRAWRPR